MSPISAPGLALVPQALCIIYVTLIWSTREAEVALMFAGQLGCEAVNFVLKRIIRRSARVAFESSARGMVCRARTLSSLPSGLWPWRCSCCCGTDRARNPGGAGEGQQQAEQPAKANGRSSTLDLAAIERYTHQPWSLAERGTGERRRDGSCRCPWHGAGYILAYHTEKQVLVGCLAGALSAVAWFIATSILRQVGLLAWALEIPVARWFQNS